MFTSQRAYVSGLSSNLSNVLFTDRQAYWGYVTLKRNKCKAFSFPDLTVQEYVNKRNLKETFQSSSRKVHQCRQIKWKQIYFEYKWKKPAFVIWVLWQHYLGKCCDREIQVLVQSFLDFHFFDFRNSRSNGYFRFNSFMYWSCLQRDFS